MRVDARPRRSVLYMPGSNERALEKARGLAADALILDLEDAVAPAEKIAARRLVHDAVKARPFGPREVIVRINGFETDWGAADLAAVAEAGPDAILLPKVESLEMVADAAARLDYHSAPPDLMLWAMVETPRGVLRAAELASHPALGCFVMGTNDLVKDLRARHTPDRAPVAAAFGLCLLAARANGMACLDGVHNAIRDAEGLRAACLQGRDMGFDGKTLIHPAQVAIANEVFAPSPEAVAEARDMLAVFAEVEKQGRGVAVLNGRVVENLHVAEAKRVLAEVEAIARLKGGA